MSASQSFNLDPAKQPVLQSQLGFVAHSCVIDNDTPYILEVGPDMRTIAAFVVGVVIAFTGTQIASAVFQTPLGGAMPGSSAQLTFSADTVPESAGTGLSTTGSGLISVNAQTLDNVRVASGVVQKSYPLSPGTGVLEISAAPNAAGNLKGLTIVGDQSGNVYYSASDPVALPPQQFYAVFEPPGLDTSATVTFTAASPGNWIVTARTDLPRFAVASTSFNIALGAGATLNLTAAVPGTTVFAFGIVVWVISAVANIVVIEDDNGQFMGQIPTNIVSYLDIDMKGSATEQGRALRFHNYGGGAAGQLTGFMLYVQAAVSPVSPNGPGMIRIA